MLTLFRNMQGMNAVLSEYSEPDNDNSDNMDKENDICSVEIEDDFDVSNLCTTTRSGRFNKT